MTLPDREYDEILSRVLHSTLDAIDPAGDGLSKIQQRIAEPWLKRQWSLLLHEFRSLGWLIFVRAEPHLSEARSGLAGVAAGSGRRLRSASLALAAAARASSPGRHTHRASNEGLAVALRKWLGPTMAWLRPALAVGGAVVLVVAGVFAVGQAQQALNPASSSGSPWAGGGGSPGAAVAPGVSHNRQGHSQPAGAQRLADGSVGHKQRPNEITAGPNATQSASPCTPSPPPSSPAPSASASPSPSPSPSTSPSSTPSPSPSPTASSGAPGTGPVVTPGGTSDNDSPACGTAA